MKKIAILNIILLMFLLFFIQPTLAKYTMNETLGLEIYIDKTPPTINLKSDNLNNNYNKSDVSNVIKDSKEITVNTRDNVCIKYNEYYYNSNNNDFSNIVANRFESGTKLSNDGYYKIVSYDISNNKTEIHVLIDKTPPDVNVKFYKKGEVAQVSNVETKTVATIKKDFLTENILEEEILEENQKIIQEEVIEENTETIEPEIALMSTRSSTIVYNESELINALNNKISSIAIGTSINCTNQLNINYAVSFSPASSSNAIRYNGYGSFININSGGTLSLSSVVIDTRGMSAGRGLHTIKVNTGGRVIFYENSIVDGGSSNYGLVVNSGGTAVIYSCHFAYCERGIVVKGNGNLTFGNLGDGRCSEFWSNTTAIFLDSFTGTCNLNQSNIKIYNNANAVVVESSSGKLNISSGQYYNNSSNGIISMAGTTNISGGSIYSNGNGVNFCTGALNITGGSIYSNKTGILLNSSYTGTMTMTGGSIYSNSSYAINHGQNSDGCCTILGGSISGKIYLAQNNNYVNTNTSYPTLSITPSTYYFNRRLVKTNSNAYANNEFSKVSMTANGSWYKYVNGEYIVVWKGCNVIVNRVDYYGNIISTETINGNLGASYTTAATEISGYDLVSVPSNANGVFTEKDITVQYKYDIKNVAQVKFEDLLSGVKSAKYWYNSSQESFSGDGTSFENNKIFEQYGYYKVIVENSVGLTKEIIFKLDVNSYTR